MNLTKAVSVSAWIKLTGPAQDQKIIGNQDNTSGGYKVGIYENKLELEIRDSGNAPTQNRYVEGGTVLEPDVWYHIVGTYCQGGSIKTYVNGKLDREIATPSLLGPSAGAVKVGCEPFDDLYWFKGLLDDLQIYNYPLAEADIAALYSGEGPPILARMEITTASAEGPAKKSYWIPVFIIVAVAVAIGTLVACKRKTGA